MNLNQVAVEAPSFERDKGEDLPVEQAGQAVPYSYKRGDCPGNKLSLEGSRDKSHEPPSKTPQATKSMPELTA